jgi:two-component system response regulator FixJ
MADITKKHIFFIDDERKLCEVVCDTLEECGFDVEYFTHAADCLEKLRSKKTCDLLITDLKMPEMDGIQLLAKAKRLSPWMPVMVITGYGDIPTAVAAIKAGAVDFIEKPLDRESFLRKVNSILQQSPSIHNYTGKPLTDAEKRVLKMVVEGRSNKEIAFMIHRSIRTVEVHRARLMHKLNVENLIDLVKRAVAMGLVELPTKKKRDTTSENPDNNQ